MSTGHERLGIRAVIMFLLMVGHPLIADNLMPNPSAERIITREEYPVEFRDSRITFAEDIPAEGWGCRSFWGKGFWGITDKEVHSGKYSVFLTVKESDRGIVKIGVSLGITDGRSGKHAIECKPNSSYVISFWIRGDCKGKGYLIIDTMEWVDEKEPPLIGGGIKKQITNEWQNHSVYLRSKEGVKKFAILISICGREENDIRVLPGDTIYIDDVEITSEADLFK